MAIMLEIKPITDTTEQKKITALCGMECKEGFFAYRATDDGRLLACAQFDIIGETAVIDAMRQVVGTEEDWEAMFILGRAVLNFMDLCGVKFAEYDPQGPFEQRIAKMIGFRGEGTTLKASLEGMFDAKCDGHGHD